MSQKLDLNFIQQSPFSLSNWSWLGLGVLLIGFVLSLFTWQMFQSNQATYSEVEAKLLALESHSGHKKIPSHIVNADISKDKKQQIQTTVTILTIPWTALLQGIEASDMQDIALLSFEPNIKKQQVGLTGEAKSLESVLLYIEKLEAQPMLDKVYLQKHNVNEADQSKPVRFTVLAQWQNIMKSQSITPSQSWETVQINEKN